MKQKTIRLLSSQVDNSEGSIMRRAYYRNGETTKTVSIHSKEEAIEILNDYEWHGICKRTYLTGLPIEEHQAMIRANVKALTQSLSDREYFFSELRKAQDNLHNLAEALDVIRRESQLNQLHRLTYL